MMKIRKGAKLRSVAGERIVMMPPVNDRADMARVVSLNPTAAWLWERFEADDFTTENIAAALAAEFDISPETALNDAATWIRALQSEGLIEN